MTPFRHALIRTFPHLRAAAVFALAVTSIVAVGAPAHGAPVVGSPTGALDSLLLDADVGLHAKGWAIDPDTDATINVGIFSDGTFLRNVAANTAHGRPATKPGHGFDLTLQRPPGTHSICIRAMNVGLGADTELGCATITFGVDPLGRVETLTQAPGGIKVGGWTLDPDVKTSINVEVYSDGTRVARLVANGPRPDVAQAYPSFGGAHGFSTTVPLPQGRHTVCVNAINVGEGSPNVALLCRVMALNYEPRGVVDALRQVPAGVAVSGWAVDPDTSDPIRVHVYIDGKAARSLVADVSRPDVTTRYPSAGTAHGFTTTVGALAGTHQICVYGINVAAGVANPTIGCRTITLNFAPIGVFEGVKRFPATRIRVAGWTADPDTSKPIQVQIGLDGKRVATVTANISRPDVAKWRHIAPLHGFLTVIPANGGEHTVCARAVNVMAGTVDKMLGCRIVISTHPVAPAAPHATARAGYRSAAVTWKPSSDGGAPPAHYTVRSSKGGKWKVVSGGVHGVVITGLAAGGRYYFTVTATNVAGTSRAGRSNVIATPRQAPPPPPQVTPPPVSTSRYIRNINGSSADVAKMRAEGANDAAHNPSGHAYLVLLDIGGQGTFGGTHGVVLSATSRFVSNADLVTALNAYVDGYASARHPGAPVVIALGTNNDMTVTTSTGLIWANEIVDPVASHTARYGAMSVAGANDFEPGFTANAAQSKAWLNGYLHGTTRPFVFNGSADGCNWTRISGGCNNGWKASDLYWLSGGASSARIIGLPQIYNTTMAKQWKYISLTGIAGQHNRIRFGGPLTEWTACRQAGSCGSLAGASAWRALWSAIRSDARTAQSSLPYSTDLRIN